MNKTMGKHIIFGGISAILLLLVIIAGPMDLFTHGYFYDEIELAEAESDLGSPYDLSLGDYVMHFSPIKDHFTGIEILLTNQPSGNSGSLALTVTDDSGKTIDMADIDLSKVKDKTWYKTYIHAKLKKGVRYTLTFSAQNCGVIPSLITIDPDYLGEETLDGNIALAYAYAEPTFNFPTKVLISVFIVSIWLWLFSTLEAKTSKRMVSRAALFLFMVAVLAWNYMFNSMDTANTRFENFQADSETLVTGPLLAEKQGIDGLNGYGLGRYYSSLGVYNTYNLAAIDDANRNRGYFTSKPAIVVNSNIYTRAATKDLATIIFPNGESFQVTAVNDDGSNIIIRLDAGKILNPGKYGAIEDITYVNSQGEEYEPALLTSYRSQFGLQGKIILRFAMHFSDDIDTLHLLCSLAAASVFALIVLLLSVKYNKVLAGIFFLTFWLSPWIVNFARNLYWVEFTWFIPMAVGLFCSWKIDNKKCRIASYLMSYTAITLKCLCGYEYISTVMMGLISFMLADFVSAAAEKNKKKQKLLFTTILIIGITAVLGFVTAICIHAPLKADGNLLKGIESIFKEDVLRRTAGADLNDWGANYWPSFNASIWEVFCRYFKFSTEVIAGVTGNLFPLICCVPLAVFAYDYRKGKLDPEMVSMYIVFFLTAVSWFCLAKSHSYIHTGMNYVMWYFGFVQICFYVIVNKLVESYRKLRMKK